MYFYRISIQLNDFIEALENTSSNFGPLVLFNIDKIRIVCSICNPLHFVSSWLVLFRHSHCLKFDPLDVVVADVEVGVEPAFFVLRRVLLSPRLHHFPLHRQNRLGLNTVNPCQQTSIVIQIMH